MNIRNDRVNFITPNWNAPNNVQALTTNKTIDLGLNNKQREDTVTKLLAKMDIPKHLEIAWLQQVHGTNVLDLNRPYCSYKVADKLPEADAAYTSSSNLICAVLSADCLPILITNKSGSVIAAIHAGWRSLANGIIENTIVTLNSLSSDLIVWMGPAIGPEKFEVGAEVREVLLENAKNKSMVDKSFISINSKNSESNKLQSGNKYLANLYLLARDRFHHLNIPEQQIFTQNFCTYSQVNDFHSYRRDKTMARMASLIWIA